VCGKRGQEREDAKEDREIALSLVVEGGVGGGGEKDRKGQREREREKDREREREREKSERVCV